MIRSIQALSCAVAAALAWGAYAAGDAGTSSSGKPAWEQVKAYSHEKKKEAVAHGKKLLAETNRKLGEMEAQAKQAGRDTKAAHEANVRELKAKREQVAQKLAAMEASTSQAWEATKEGFANAYQDLQQAYDKARAPR